MSKPGHESSASLKRRIVISLVVAGALTLGTLMYNREPPIRGHFNCPGADSVLQLSCLTIAVYNNRGWPVPYTTFSPGDDTPSGWLSGANPIGFLLDYLLAFGLCFVALTASNSVRKPRTAGR